MSNLGDVDLAAMARGVEARAGAREIQMFGMRKATLELGLARALDRAGNNPVVLAISMLSDAQEQMMVGASEAARQTLNAVKFLLDSRLS